MISKFIKNLRTLLTSVELFNKQINQYKLISKEPALPSYAYINWGLFLINSGKKDRGIQKLNQSVMMNKSNPEVYMNIGITYAQDKKFEEALVNFKKAVRLDKNNAKAWGYLAGVYSEINEMTLAKSAFEKSLRLDRANPYTYLNYGIFCIKNNQKETAKTMFKKAFILDPVNVQPLLMWGIILINEHEYQNAFFKFRKILDIEPFHPDALYLCGLCSSKLEQYEKSIEYCKKSCSLKADKLENYVLIADSYLNLHDEKNCLDSFSEYEKFCFDDWKFYNSWGVALQSFDKWSESIEKYEKSIQLKDDEYITHSGLSYALIKTNDLSRAKEEIKKVLILQPEFATSYYNLGQIYMKEEQYDKAIDSYKKALSIDVNLKKTYFNLAGAYHLKGDTKNAVKYWEKTVDYDPRNANAYLNLATTYLYDFKDNVKALRYIRSAFEIDKSDANVVFKYGLVLFKTEDYYRAQEKFIDAYKLDNNLIEAELALSECKLKLNKPHEALEILNKYQDKKGNDKDFLMVKLMSLAQIAENEKENQELKNTIIQICDKILNEFGESPTVEEIKQQYTSGV